MLNVTLFDREDRDILLDHLDRNNETLTANGEALDRIADTLEHMAALMHVIHAPAIGAAMADAVVVAPVEPSPVAVALVTAEPSPVAVAPVEAPPAPVADVAPSSAPTVAVV